ncbi:MAG TPA: hypothetical protein VGK73_24055, partial [Polyangiaceae bacterium]
MTAEAENALLALSLALAEQPELERALRARFRTVAWDAKRARARSDLPPALLDNADLLSSSLPALTRLDGELSKLSGLLETPSGTALLAFCSATVWRGDVRMAPLLRHAMTLPHLVESARGIARSRVVEGPLLDALECAPLLGDGLALGAPENGQARARLEILIWEAGARALEVPALGQWLFGSRETFHELVRGPAHGALRGRVLAARCLEVSVCGLPNQADPELVGWTLQVLQPLLLHPEPLVWVHAARALGRLTGRLEQLEGTLLDWVLGESRILRQRAMTAFASLPAERLKFLASQLVAILESPSEEAWVLAAVAAATPYLFFERRPLWDRLAARILSGDGGAIAARTLARGLASLFRRGVRAPEVERPMRALREMAIRARATSLDELRRWIDVTALTDVVDSAERDPLDLELGMENLVRVAAQYDDEEADARAARFASSLAPAFQEARRIALGSGRLRQRAAAINALEGSARTFALRLWAPLLATRPPSDPVDEPNLEETWKAIARAPAEILDLV